MALLAGRWPAAAPLLCSSGCGLLWRFVQNHSTGKTSPKNRPVISHATTLGELLIPLLNWSITGQEWGEDGEGERVGTLKRRRRLRVTARLFSLFVRDPIS